MSLGEVDDVDVVADAGSVGGIVVITEDTELLADADSGLGEVRDEVLGNAIGHLSDDGGGMRADGVEITQEDGLDGRTAGHGVLDDFLVDLLGVAIGGLGLLDGRFLCGGELVGLTIDGAGGGEDDAFDIVLRHQL